MKKYISRSIARAVIKFLSFFAIFNAINEVIKFFVNNPLTPGGGFAASVGDIYGWSVAIMLFTVFSVAWAFYGYNNRVKERFIENYDANIKQKKLKLFFSAFKTLDFLLDTAVSFALSLISAVTLGYGDIEAALFGGTELNGVLKSLFTGLIVGFAFLLANWVTVYDVRRRWARYDTKNKADGEKAPHPVKEALLILGYLCFITVIYTLGFMVAIAYVPGLATYAYIIKVHHPKIIIGIAVIAAASFLLINLKRIVKRKEFVKNLTKTASARGFELSEIKKPYLSLFKQAAGESFTVTAHGRTYKCKLISGKSKGVHMIFGDKGLLLFKRSIIIGKREVFSFYSAYDYAFESDVKKCVVLTCIPAKCYYKDTSGRMREIDTGEKIGEYTIFSAQGFLRGLEMDCLDR